MLVLLAGMSIGSRFVPSRQMYILPEEVPGLSYPYSSWETVPVWALVLGTLGCPAAAIVMFAVLGRMQRLEAYRAVVYLIAACICSDFAASCIQLVSGRPRPNFFGRCLGNAQLPPKNITWTSPGHPSCTGSHEIVLAAYRSFPSGNVAFAFAGLVQLSFHLVGKLGGGINLHERTFAELLAAALPILLAVLVAASRVVDLQNFTSDTIAGAVLGAGISAAALCQLRSSLARENHRSVTSKDFNIESGDAAETADHCSPFDRPYATAVVFERVKSAETAACSHAAGGSSSGGAQREDGELQFTAAAVGDSLTADGLAATPDVISREPSCGGVRLVRSSPL